MKKYKTVKKSITIEELDKTVCNMCGESFPNTYDEPITEVQFNFGYGSKYDNERWDIDLCDNCIEKIVKTFKIKP